MSRAHSYSRNRAHSQTFLSHHLCHNSFSNPSLALLTSQLILQPFRCFTDAIANSPTLLLLLLRHRIFTYVVWRAAHACERQAHSPSFPSLHLRHSSFTKISVSSPTSQLNLQPFPRFTYVTAHSPTHRLLHLRHSSFSNPSIASPTSQTLHLIHLASRP